MEQGLYSELYKIIAAEIITPPAAYIDYTILQVQHYCDKSTPKLFTSTMMCL